MPWKDHDNDPTLRNVPETRYCRQVKEGAQGRGVEYRGEGFKEGEVMLVQGYGTEGRIGKGVGLW